MTLYPNEPSVKEIFSPVPATPLAEWDFAQALEHATTSRCGRYRLVVNGGGVQPIEEGVRFDGTGWLSLTRAECGPLDIHGPDAALTVVARVRRRGRSRCQFVAGVWDETRRKRQYGMFLNLTGRYDSADNVHGHVSADGGPTAGDRCCITYATGGTPLALDRWYTLAFSYNGKHARVYVDGRLDSNGAYNPYAYPDGILCGGADGADFTIGACHAGGRMNNFLQADVAYVRIYDGLPEKHDDQRSSALRPALQPSTLKKILS